MRRSVIPQLRITDLGLVDVGKFALTSVTPGRGGWPAPAGAVPAVNPAVAMSRCRLADSCHWRASPAPRRKLLPGTWR